MERMEVTKIAKSLFRQFVENVEKSKVEIFGEVSHELSYAENRTNFGVNTALPQHTSTPYQARVNSAVNDGLFPRC